MAIPQGVYLPTMQEDFLAEVKKSGIAGTYYGEEITDTDRLRTRYLHVSYI